MGPVATKAMKGYSDEDLREDIDDFKVKKGKANLDIYDDESSLVVQKIHSRDKVKPTQALRYTIRKVMRFHFVQAISRD